MYMYTEVQFSCKQINAIKTNKVNGYIFKGDQTMYMYTEVQFSCKQINAIKTNKVNGYIFKGDHSESSCLPSQNPATLKTSPPGLKT